MEKQGNKTLGIVGMVLGIFSIVSFYWSFFSFASLAAGIVGIILAIKSKKSFAEAGQQSGIPTAALVLSIIGTVLSVIGISCTICVCAAATTAIGSTTNSAEVSDILSSLISSY